MELLFQNCTEQLKADPVLLNELTDRLLKEAAKQHHPHNRLLPASFLQLLLMQVAPEQILGSNQQGQRYVLALNCIRNMLIANFPQLEENKVFRAIVMNHAQTLNLIVQKERANMLEGEGLTLKYAARGFIANQIILKLAQISHVFLPELLRFAKNIIEIGLKYLQEYSQQSSQVEVKEFKMVSRLAPKSKIPKHLYKLTCRKIWKKSSFVIFIKSLFQQVKTFLTTCGYSKHALGLQIYKEIQEDFDNFKNMLTPAEQTLLNLQEATAESKENDEVYLEEPLKVRELTPRFYDEEQSMILGKLRKKKQKLTKKIQTELRKGVIVKQQEAHVRDEVRREKSQRQQKKEQLIIEKQTVEVKKFNKQIKKVKHATKKSSKGSSKPSFMTNPKRKK